MGRWPDVVSTRGGQTELAILPVRAVTEHHHSKLHSRTCSEQNKLSQGNYEISVLLTEGLLLHQFHLKL
jgi:hypothetical protein